MPPQIPLADARRIVLERSGFVLDPESVELERCLGRHLAQDYHADVPWPTTDRSAMDGFALRWGRQGGAAGTSFRVVGTALAGHPFDGEVGAGEAVRIMTGGVLPKGADTVVKVEDTSGYEGPVMTLRSDVEAGANIRRAGSEIAVGDLLLRAGQRLRAAEIGALAVLGITPVPVVRRPRVAIVSTGDEVVAIDRVPRPWQVRDSNSWALAAKVTEAGGVPERLGIVRDDRAELSRVLSDALGAADVLMTIGGVSQGTHDLVHGVLQELGVRRVFHGIALKPGKPVFFGEHGPVDRPRFVFGLPGNPASCFTVFDLLVWPLLARLCGAAEPPALLARPVGARFRPNRRAQAIPARLSTATDPLLRAELQPARPSGDPFGLLAGDAYALIPPDADPDSTEQVTVLPYSSRFGDPLA